MLKQFEFHEDQNLFKEFLAAEENGSLYMVCCGTIHCKNYLIFSAAIKLPLFIHLLIIRSAKRDAIVATFGLLLGFIAVLATYLLLILALSRKDYRLLIPYIFVCFLTIFISTVDVYFKIFHASTMREQIGVDQMITIALDLFTIIFEVYILLASWYAFAYICDLMMKETVRKAKDDSTTFHGILIDFVDEFSANHDTND